MKISTGIPLLGLRALFRDSSESDALAARGFILPNNGVPAACTAVCDEPISTVNALKNCNDVTQCADVLCTNAFLDGVDRCSQCATKNRGMTATDAESLANEYDRIRQGCLQLGYSVGQTSTAAKGSGELALRAPGVAVTVAVSAVVLIAVSSSVL